MYKRETTRFLNAVEVEERRASPKREPGHRGARKKPTPEEMEARNQWQRVKTARQKLRANFDIEDYFSTFTFRKDARPPDMGQARKIFTKAIRAIREEYRKRGYQLKYLRNIECGTKGAWHVHVILNRIPDTDVILTRVWRFGQVISKLLRQAGEFAKLAEYITKTPKTDPRLKEASYSASRGLPVPEPQKKEYKRWKKWREIRPPEGYYLDKDSYHEGINPVTGTSYRYYTFLRLKHERMPEGRNRLPENKAGRKRRGPGSGRKGRGI